MAAMPVEAAWEIAGKTVVFTGCTAGIGRETDRQLAARGAHVVMACRNLPLAKKVAEEIRQQHPGCQVEVGPQLDLASLDSVRQFAAEYKQRYNQLHVLVNNAGGNATWDQRWFTPDSEGVGGLCQVNYLGPYALTRLLEDKLQHSAPARVVKLSSVTHRYGIISNPASFLSTWSPGFSLTQPSYYPTSKLSNVLFTYEMQRRLGGHGVQSCSVDPGTVVSNIWKSAALSREPPASWLINAFYAPTWDGAAAVVHAATVPWEEDQQTAAAINQRWAVDDVRQQQNNGKHGLPDLRMYARGVFTWPIVTSWGSNPHGGLLHRLSVYGWACVAVLSSLLDWPLRRWIGGPLLAQTHCVPSAPHSYDAALAAQLWDVSADAANLLREITRVSR